MSQDDLKLDHQVCFPVYALSREVIQRYRPLLDQLDITYPQYLVLLILWECEPKTVSQLGDKLHLDSGTLTPLLKRMEQKGFIFRSRSAKDERVVEISLSPTGVSLKKEAECIPSKIMEALGISMKELSDLQLIVNKILHQIKKCD